MTWMHGVRARLRLLRRGAAEERMEEEMRFHLEMEAERLAREEGLSADEAWRRAVVTFGGMEGHKEEMREGRTLGWIGGLSLDLRLGGRMLGKHWGLSLIGGFAIAVGVAVGAMGFELIGEVLHPAIPVEQGGRVVSIQYATSNPGNPERRILHEFAEWREELETVEQLGAFRTVTRNLVTGEVPPEPVEVAEITATGFVVARTPPLLGRYLVTDDERPGGPRVVVIGYEAWRLRFESDPAVVGRTVQLGSEPHEIVGVMPEGFRFPVSHGYWVPLRAVPSEFERLEGPALHVFGRLAPGFTRAEAQAELTTVGRRAAAAFPETHERFRLLVLPYTSDHLEGLDHPPIRRALRIAQLLVSGLLVVVAVNLAILFYARTVARSGEIAVRSALGASRGRILAQLFLEALALSAVGATAGLVLAKIVLDWLRVQFSVMDDLPFWVGFDLSAATVLYVLGLAALAAAIMGIVPGMKAMGSRLDVNLREAGGGGGTRLGRVWTSLIVAQVAIAVAILPPAVFAVWRVMQMEVAELGFPPEEFVVGSVELGEQDAGGGSATGEEERRSRVAARQAELIRRLEAEPGVTGVAYSSAVPGIEGVSRPIELEAGETLTEGVVPRAGSVRVGPGLFDVYDAEIVEGRGLDAGDLGEARTVVVNRRFADELLGGRPALGQRFRYVSPDRGGADGGNQEEWYEIVGVVENVPTVPLEAASMSDGVANVYHAAAPGEIQPVKLSIRLRGEVSPVVLGRIRQVGSAVDPALQLRLRPLTDQYGSLRAGSRTLAWGLALITSSVLLLSAAGIYALMSFTVAQRTREIGIRAALGAGPGRILYSIFQRVLRQLAVGLLIGSVAAGALFSNSAFSAGRGAPLLLAVAAIVLAVGLLAAVGPARRGLRVQPAEALREG